jgi:Mg2+/citrate symporter
MAFIHMNSFAILTGGFSVHLTVYFIYCEKGMVCIIYNATYLYERERERERERDRDRDRDRETERERETETETETETEREPLLMTLPLWRPAAAP